MNVRIKFFACATMLGAFMLGGCATILNDQTQSVNVTSSTGTAIKGTVGGQSFNGPGVVRLEREKADKIFITDTEGCVKETAAPSSVDTKFFINILSGGAFGSSTDFSSGRMWKYSENIIINCQK